MKRKSRFRSVCKVEAGGGHYGRDLQCLCEIHVDVAKRLLEKEL